MVEEKNWKKIEMGSNLSQHSTVRYIVRAKSDVFHRLVYHFLLAILIACQTLSHII